jgi:site-specific recombinase XerD
MPLFQHNISEPLKDYHMLNYKISFYIRANRLNQQGKAPIYYRLWIENEKHEASTGQQIEPKHWDEKGQKVVKSPDAKLINNVLHTIKSDLLQAITNLHLGKAELTHENIRKILKGDAVQETHYLIKVTTEHNQMFEKQVEVKYSYGSYKNYKTTLAFLKEFVQHQFQRPDIPLKEVNQKFCEHYFVWLTTVKTSKQNGAAKHIQRLKKIMNYSIRMGYITYNPIHTYSVVLKQVPRVALTWEEIIKIQELPLQTEVLRHIRNIFIFQVFTGLAYSDVKALSQKHLMKGTDNKIWIRMERTKTHNTFVVPLLQAAMEILQQYMTFPREFDAPIFPVLSNQKMNQNLKVIQEIAGISKSLHTHLPRHTFASTVTLLNGVPLETVSKMLGHSKITMTTTYAKVGELKISKDMLLLEQKLNKKTP